MGFDVNFNKPMIRETQSMQDGGAGNLGYFENEEKKREKDKSIFAEAQETDSFKKGGQENLSSDFSLVEFIENLFTSIVNWFKKLFNLS